MGFEDLHRAHRAAADAVGEPMGRREHHLVHGFLLRSRRLPPVCRRPAALRPQIAATSTQRFSFAERTIASTTRWISQASRKSGMNLGPPASDLISAITSMVLMSLKPS